MTAGSAREDGRIVIYVPYIDDDICETRQTFAALICGQDNETPDSALLAVKRPLGIDLPCDLVNYEFTVCTLAVERVTQGLLVGVLIWVSCRYLQCERHSEPGEATILQSRSFYTVADLVAISRLTALHKCPVQLCTLWHLNLAKGHLFNPKPHLSSPSSVCTFCSSSTH